MRKAYIKSLYRNILFTALIVHGYDCIPLIFFTGHRVAKTGAWLLHSEMTIWKLRSSALCMMEPKGASTPAAWTPSFGYAGYRPLPQEGHKTRNETKIQMLQQKMGFQVESMKGQVFVHSRSAEPKKDWWHFKALLMIHAANKLQEATGVSTHQRMKCNCFLVNRVIWKVFVPSC